MNKDTLSLIFKSLTVKNIGIAAQVCRDWYRIIDTDIMTKQIYPLLPPKIKNGVIIPAFSEGFGHDIVVFDPYDTYDGKLAVETVWKKHFPNYPKLSGSFANNCKIIHDSVYPELYYRAAMITYLHMPIPNYDPPRPDLIDMINGKKIMRKFLDGKNTEEILWKLGVFRNTPRMAKFIPLLVNEYVDLRDDRFDKIMITDEVYSKAMTILTILATFVIFIVIILKWLTGKIELMMILMVEELSILIVYQNSMKSSS